KADGYGKLILPYDTVNNVLRIRNVGSYQDTTGSGFTVATHQDTIITFYNTSINHRIASITSLYSNGSRQSYQATYLSQSDLATALRQE
ncbi:MAG: hypothetical protein ABEH38_08030, partial [Flavobacteriales bacterium]